MLTKTDALANMAALYPGSTPAQREAALAPHTFKNYHKNNELVVFPEAYANAVATLKQELDALVWIDNNPTQALARLMRGNHHNPAFSELDMALLILASTYDVWADSKNASGEFHHQVEKRVAARQKARQLRDTAKAIEIAPTERID